MVTLTALFQSSVSFCHPMPALAFLVFDSSFFFGAGVMVTLDGTEAVEITASETSRVLLIGGDPLGERHLYWNFVSDSIERIEQAKEDWRAGNFDRVPGDDEFIPLPGEE